MTKRQTFRLHTNPSKQNLYAVIYKIRNDTHKEIFIPNS